MMIRAKLRSRLMAVSASVAVTVAAMGMTAPAYADERLITHTYSDNEVVRIDGRSGVQATIAFGKGEAIENVAVGDSQAWQITPNKRADLLFVKPLEATARTNMTVVTNRRTYFFDLVASPRSRPLYMLRFAYKDEQQTDAAGGSTYVAGLDPVEQDLVQGKSVALPSDPASLNFAWSREGAAKLMPARVYDDGTSTYLLWPERAAVPAILVTNEKGDEGPVNYAVRGVTIVLEDVPGKIILRSGKAKAILTNTRPQAVVSIASGEAAPVIPKAQSPLEAQGSVTTSRDIAMTSAPTQDN